jgi:hypothetical protein
MPRVTWPCYEGTKIEIREGHCVAVAVNGRAVIGVVRTVSMSSGRIEVMLPRSAVPHLNCRRRSFRRVDVTPVPGLVKGDLKTGLPGLPARYWTALPVPALRVAA